MNAKTPLGRRQAGPALPPAPRNPVARALAVRAASGAAGSHRRAVGGQRRADRMALQRSLRGGDHAA